MRNPVGGHVPVAGGLATVGLGYARELGAETVQVFVANPRGWATPAGNPARTSGSGPSARRRRSRSGCTPRT